MEDRQEALVQRLLCDPSFQRWAQSEASSETPADAEGQTTWDEWAQQSDAHARAVREAKRTVCMMQFAPAPVDSDVTDAAWERLDRARTAASTPPASGTKRQNRPPKRRTRTPLRRSAPAWAATALVALLAIGVVLLQQSGWSLGEAATERVVQTDYGERTTVAVNNEITATLSGNSTLSYTEEEPHRLELNGEARFEVAARPEGHPPVDVNTPDGMVRVMGTTFTVTHWDAHTDVVLASGSVEVTPKDVEAEPHTLTPGDWVTFARVNGIQQQRTTNVEAYQSWTTDTIVFDDTPMADIADRIERVYGHTVIIEDEDVRMTKISGAVENQLDVLVEGLRGILDRPIEHDNQRIVIR